MHLTEWYYLPVAALIGSLFTIIWQKTLAHKIISSFKVFVLIFLGSLFNAWGIDFVQRMEEIDTITHVLQVSLGCWLMFAAATGVKYYAIDGRSKKDFVLDYGGSLLSFMLIGLIIFCLT